DFGYWYVPDGRNVDQQLLFQRVEVKPQAMEWILSVAASHPFRLSVDNLNGGVVDPLPFKRAVHSQVIDYCTQGLPKRAACFRSALCDFYGNSTELRVQDFDFNACG
ncbi:MAG: elongation factor P hydroxylase, partial [Cyclobacteriaceae bacterium]|nr:elongation factor P hydroxylase [Cyclobacteriaceae bacterium]